MPAQSEMRCDDCGRNLEGQKVIKGMCRTCYHRHWFKTQAGQSRLRRKADQRKAVPTASKRLRNAEEAEPTSAAWYSTTAKITEESQRLIFAMWSAGRDAVEIARVVKHPATLVQSLIDRGVISPQRVAPYRCPGCSNRVVTLPCFICESKRIHANSRKVREVSA